MSTRIIDMEDVGEAIRRYDRMRFNALQQLERKMDELSKRIKALEDRTITPPEQVQAPEPGKRTGWWLYDHAADKPLEYIGTDPPVLKRQFHYCTIEQLTVRGVYRRTISGGDGRDLRWGTY